MAVLRGAQILAYLNDMSRILRSVRLALDSLATLVQSFPNSLAITDIFIIQAKKTAPYFGAGYLQRLQRLNTKR